MSFKVYIIPDSTTLDLQQGMLIDGAGSNMDMRGSWSNASDEDVWISTCAGKPFLSLVSCISTLLAPARANVAYLRYIMQERRSDFELIVLLVILFPKRRICPDLTWSVRLVSASTADAEVNSKHFCVMILTCSVKAIYTFNPRSWREPVSFKPLLGIWE